MSREQGDPVLADAQASETLDECIEFPRADRMAAVARGTLLKMKGTDAAGASGAMNSRGLLQSAGQVPAISGRQPVVENRFTATVDRHATFGDVAHQHDRRCRAMEATHGVLVGASARPGDREGGESGMPRCAL